MNKSLYNGVICILIFVIAGLSLMLYQSQQTIKTQQATIASNQAKITDLEGQIKELQAKQNTVNTIIQSAGDILKEKGVQFIQGQLQK